MSDESLVEKIAAELKRNDEAGPGPVSEAEYLDDAAAILRVVAEHDPSTEVLAAALVSSGEMFDSGMQVLAAANRAVQGLMEIAERGRETGDLDLARVAIAHVQASSALLAEAIA